MFGIGRSPQPFAAVAAALAVMVISQLVRLQQTTVELWLAADYAGRLVSIAILLIAPTARAMAFNRVRLAVGAWEAVMWVAGLVVLDLLVLDLVRDKLDAAFPGMRLDSFPELSGGLLVLDMTFGVALVAFHEETFFRRLARAMLRPRTGDAWVMVIVSAALFGLYHWQFGVGNIFAAFVFGIMAMLFYKRAGCILPAVIAHYLVDVRHVILVAN